MLLVGAAAGALVAALGGWGHLMLGRTRLLNMPYRRHWSRPENVARGRALLQVDLAPLAAGLFVLMGGAYALVAAAALGTPLAPWLFPVLMALFVGALLGYALWLQFGPRYRPTAHG